ncbi:DUF6496 domain-containing protein [Candidatus Chromulinivorax destructor]|nr:DUF6496 domain-containing protein [Candidatus Chromulinivorax destructor]
MVKKRIKKCESCSLTASKLNTCMTCGQEKTMQAKVAVVMKEFKEHSLHSRSKTGPLVTNPKQAIAIALSEGRKAAGVPQIRIKKAK